jgi:hypothetical protein
MPSLVIRADAPTEVLDALLSIGFRGLRHAVPAEDALPGRVVLTFRPVRG